MTISIETNNYEGYLWYSDQSIPVMIPNETVGTIVLNDGDNPFVIEGQLWNKTDMESVSIKYIDGRYFVKSVNVGNKDLEGAACATPISYIAHRLPGVSKLKFLKYWEETEDEFCENMKVLKQTKVAFVGFEYNRKEDNV